MKTLLDRILETKKDDIQRARAARPIKDLQRKVKDTPKPLSFRSSLTRDGFGIIAEIKKKSPSMSDMLPANVSAASEAYKEKNIVKAASILTDWTYFGMTIEELERLKPIIGKPVLRKDFIFDEYQVWEARAFGADAILVMASMPVSKRQIQVLFDLATDLGMDVLFEVHSVKEIDRVPDKAKIYGINSRKFKTGQKSLRYRLSRLARNLGLSRLLGIPDLSTDLSIFEELISQLPRGVVKVAESGVKPSGISRIRELHFDCALIGTALLQAPGGIRQALDEFSTALEGSAASAPAPTAVPVS